MAKSAQTVLSSVSNRKPFDWENEELAETLPEPEEPVYPDVLAEVPGLVLKSDLPDDDDAIMEPEEPTFEEQAAAALASSGVVPENIPEITGVGGKITGVVSDLFPSVTVNDTFDDNVEGINPPNLITRQQVQVEDVEDDDEDDDDFLESVNAPSNNLEGDQANNENTGDAPQFGRGARVRNPPDYYQADHSDIRYTYNR